MHRWSCWPALATREVALLQREPSRACAARKPLCLQEILLKIKMLK